MTFLLTDAKCQIDVHIKWTFKGIAKLHVLAHNITIQLFFRTCNNHICNTMYVSGLDSNMHQLRAIRSRQQRRLYQLFCAQGQIATYIVPSILFYQGQIATHIVPSILCYQGQIATYIVPSILCYQGQIAAYFVQYNFVLSGVDSNAHCRIYFVMLILLLSSTVNDTLHI